MQQAVAITRRSFAMIMTPARLTDAIQLRAAQLLPKIAAMVTYAPPTYAAAVYAPIRAAERLRPILYGKGRMEQILPSQPLLFSKLPTADIL